MSVKAASRNLQTEGVCDRVLPGQGYRTVTRVWSNGGMITAGETAGSRRKICSIVTSSAINIT